MDWAPILTELERRRTAARAMGGEERLAAHHANGKLNARQRAAALFDPGTFVEIGTLAGAPGTDGLPPPADGLIAGSGLIEGRPALCGVEDFTVLAGSIGDAGSSKRYRLTELAAREKMPLVFMLEGAGHRLTNHHANPAPNDLHGLARLSGQVPMVCLVMGPSAGHGALTAPLSDFVVMTPQASLFVAGPPIVKAAIGEVVTKEELGGPQVHLASGVAHNLAADDASAVALARQYLSYFGPSSAPAESERQLDAILDLINPDPRVPFAVLPILAMLADAESLLEVQPHYGGALVTALARLGGQAVAIVASNPAVNAGSVDAAAAQKAAHFIEVADAHGLPLVFLADTPGVMPGSVSERAGTLRHAARMFAAQHRARVPKLHVTLRKAFGFGSSIMAMNPFDNQTVSLAFPAISLGAMPAGAGASAAGLDPDAAARALAEQTASAWNLSGRMAYDEVIDPRELRNALLHGLRLCAGRQLSPRNHEGILP
ncbi:acyl-CoA carboxylase subunit beta [Novosphingobium sp. B 225]|uniref:acyl-CoA carboxylase subunit beta n=1 Tax=Novosphingobium sp. B 225 TaxID=1961849 RepID=UPI000B4B25D9|nr:carboxyl transferase domain-containing protein [Novosphingobium sp. B 225]